MRSRQVLGLVLLVAVLGIVFPGSSQAGVHGEIEIGARVDQPALFARVVDWFERWLAPLTQPFSAREGATASTNG